MLPPTGAVEIVKIQGHAVSGDGGAQNGNVGSRGSGGGQGRRVALAMIRSTPSETKPLTIVPRCWPRRRRFLFSNSTWAGEASFRASIKPWVAAFQRGVLHQLADADLIGGALGGGIVRAGGGCLRLGAACQEARDSVMAVARTRASNFFS